MFRKEEREKIVPLHFIRFYLYVLLWLFLDIREWRVILRRRTIFSLWFLTISCRSFAIIQATNIPLDSSNQYTKTVYDKMNEIKTMCVRDVVRILVRHGFVFSLQRKIRFILSGASSCGLSFQFFPNTQLYILQMQHAKCMCMATEMAPNRLGRCVCTWHWTLERARDTGFR